MIAPSMLLPNYDPYDIWSLPLLGRLKSEALSSRRAFILAAAFSLSETLFPAAVRRFTGIAPLHFPQQIALEVQTPSVLSQETAVEALRLLRNSAYQGEGYQAWGLPFYWYSKNGTYPPGLPFVTHTPYVMEALLRIAELPACNAEAMQLFFGTWGFLEALHVMEQSDSSLALSYAPVPEPRLVVNANSYAGFAYALHAVHGQERHHATAREKARRLVTWIVMNQSSEGHWPYYLDNLAGNFTDGFHSCFVLKNLLKIAELLPEQQPIIQPAVEKGWRFVQERFYDPRAQLCRRFDPPLLKDPFRWELYDQAEYLGLLVDFGQLEEAVRFRSVVERRFKRNGHWYCRIDLLGRRWGKEFRRWGIVPFLYQAARLDRAIADQEVG